MLHNWSGRLMVPLMLIAATLALVAPASAGIVCDCWFEWDNGTANELDFDVHCLVVQIETGGYSYTDPNGTSYTIGSGYVGKYLYLYELKVQNDADNSEEPEWFQVNWGAVDMHAQGHIDGSWGGRTVAWSDEGWYTKAPGGGVSPSPGGTWISWTVISNSGKNAGQVRGDWLGTFWAISGGTPKIGDGLVANNAPVSQGVGEACVPSPEVPTLLLLMTSGVPMVGLGYLRRRRIA